MKTRKINIKFNNAKELIKLYIESDVKVNWGSEIKIANKLLSQFPEIEFWRGFALGVVKFDSLCVFLNKQYTSKKDVILESKPVVEIKIFKSKPRSIMDFVDSVM